MSIRYGKIWQTSDHQLVFQISLSKADLEKYNLDKKVYLIISVSQSLAGLSLSRVKPPNTIMQHALVNILRKHCRTGVICGIYNLKEPHATVLQLGSGGSLWQLYLLYSKPPELSFIGSDGIKMIRFGQSGTYTKKQPCAPISIDQLPDELGAFLEKGLRDEDQADTPASNGNRPDADTGKPIISKQQRQLAKRLQRRVKTIKAFITKQERQLPSEQDISYAMHQAETLKMFSYRITPDTQELVIQAKESSFGEEISVKISHEVAIGKQIDAAFRRWQKLLRGRSLGLEHLKSAQEQLQHIQGIVSELREKELDPNALERMEKKFKLKPSPSSANSPLKATVKKPAFRTFNLGDELKAKVGKDAVDNDTLTKSAGAQDYWLHVVSGTGSHVVVPIAKSSQQLSPQSIREAAILAIHYSHHRQSRCAEVYITRKRHLRKQKGMAPGKWQVLRSESIFVSYEQQELDAIVNR